ncbi:MAG: aromatic amino acid lyase [Myxococcota bacterium]
MPERTRPDRTVAIDGRTLGWADLAAISRGEAAAKLEPEARQRMADNAAWYAEHAPPDLLRSKWAWLVGGTPPAHTDEAVRLFVVSHCAGVGEPLPANEVRAMIAARANALAAGWSGVRPIVVDRLLALLERDLVPVVPAVGAVGAAGSIQLAHVARVALGFGGEVLVDGVPAPAGPAIAALGPVVPTEKEALSLINGASWSNALAGLAVDRAARVLRAAESAAALSLEVVRAEAGLLSVAAARVRGHAGAEAATRRLRDLVEGSELVAGNRRPDSFSVRCAPVVLGAACDALGYVQGVVAQELNAPSDNPLVLPDAGGVVEGGLFHAAPVALAMDHLKVTLVQVASIAERRIFRMTYGRLSGLPSFLVADSGVNSGLMLAQYTAASLLAEARAMCVPASTDSIPTVQHQEDHVSMGPVAARSALEVVDRVADIVAIELLCAAQGLDLRMSGLVQPDGEVVPPQQPGPRTRALHARVRALVERWDDDQVLHPDLAALGRAVREGVFS